MGWGGVGRFRTKLEYRQPCKRRPAQPVAHSRRRRPHLPHEGFGLGLGLGSGLGLGLGLGFGSGSGFGLGLGFGLVEHSRRCRPHLAHQGFGTPRLIIELFFVPKQARTNQLRLPVGTRSLT